MPRYNAILLVGPPGSGKGTQGRALASLPGYLHCSCGEVFRSVDPGSAAGRAFLEHSGRGLLVPDELTLRLWMDWLQQRMASHVRPAEGALLVLDGIPRNKNQAELMDGLIHVHHVLHLTGVPRHEVIRRIQRRAMQDQRSDDADEQVIQRRLDIYEAEAAALLSHYPRGHIRPINAAQPAGRVHHDILAAIACPPHQRPTLE